MSDFVFAALYVTICGAVIVAVINEHRKYRRRPPPDPLEPPPPKQRPLHQLSDRAYAVKIVQLKLTEIADGLTGDALVGVDEVLVKVSRNSKPMHTTMASIDTIRSRPLAPWRSSVWTEKTEKTEKDEDDD